MISYFDQILDGAEFTYVCKKKKTDHSLQIEQLQKEINKLTMRESRIKEAYEAGVDTLEEYKNNKDRLVSDRLELTAALSQLLQEEQAEQPDAEEILKEIRSVADVLKNPANPHKHWAFEAIIGYCTPVARTGRSALPCVIFPSVLPCRTERLLLCSTT